MHGTRENSNGPRFDFPGLQCLPDGVGTCDVQAQVVRQGSVTTYEIRIPGTFPATIGFDVLVNENDGASRDGWLEWTPGVGFGKDPSLFGGVLLVDEPPPVEPQETVSSPSEDISKPISEK